MGQKDSKLDAIEAEQTELNETKNLSPKLKLENGPSFKIDVDPPTNSSQQTEHIFCFKEFNKIKPCKNSKTSQKLRKTSNLDENKNERKFSDRENNSQMIDEKNYLKWNFLSENFNQITSEINQSGIRSELGLEGILESILINLKKKV